MDLKNKEKTLMQCLNEYLSKGWKVIPIFPREKRPIHSDWPNLRLTKEDLPQYFSGDENVGVLLGEPSNWLTDVDIDNKRALKIAHYFLPTTGTIFGRSQNPYSHWLYYSKGSKTTKFSFDDESICEIRSSGSQTVFPPSIHTTGDVYEWYEEGDPQIVSFETLKNSVSKMVSCVVLSKFYPKEGTRHEAMLALSGWLYRCGWTYEEIKNFISALCDLAGDEEKKDRIILIKDTIEKIDRGDPATGFPRLTNYFLEPILEKISKWLEIKSAKKFEDEEKIDAKRDYGHALALSKVAKNKFRWIYEWGKWIEYQSGVWKETTEERVAKEATDTLLKYYSSLLSNAKDKKESDELTQKIKEIWVYSRVSGALNFLKGFSDVMTSTSQLDSIPWTLNVKNGTLDLKTLELKPHTPDDLFTKQTTANWDPHAKIDAWQAHLDFCLPNKNIQREIKRELGLALTGLPLEELLPIWFGCGANGKSTTLRVIMDVMGDYAQMAAPRLLMKSKYERHSTELAELQGRRLVFSTETGENGALDEEKMKWLTGGERLRARFMRQDNFEFSKTWLIVLVTNYKPSISGTDEGTWRRIRLIPWEQSLPKEKQLPQEEVVQKLLSERDGILRWLVEGLIDWLENKHWVANEVLIATETYREEEDILKSFLDDCCEFKPHFTIEVSKLYENYLSWCELGAIEPVGKNIFGKLLKKRGIAQKRGTGGVNLWVGLRLKNDGSHDLPYA